MKVLISILVLISIVGGSFASVVPVPIQESKLKENEALEVFILPHSHDDVGWLHTFQEYYDRAVHSIYDQVVEQLSGNSDYRFICVETAFFAKWWRDNTTTDIQRQNFTRLLKNGQLEFINGGWVMQDEAVTSYQANIDQMTLGHSYTYDLFGEIGIPRVGWHIDPFGSSAETPTQFALMGFNAFIIDRIDYIVKDEFELEKGLQFVWRGSPNYKKEAELFTYDLDHFGYCAPSEFYTPVTNATNLKQIAEDLVDNIKLRSAYFKTNNVLWPWGCDFTYNGPQAEFMFENMVKLMDYINSKPEFNMNLKYSTLSNYLKAVNEAGVTWGVREDKDFLPYADNSESWWTGFYTSRPHLKGFERSLYALKHSTELLYSLNSKHRSEALFEKLETVRENHAIVQHHDAVTGTEKSFVVDDYVSLLETAESAAQTITTTILNSALAGTESPKLVFDMSSLNKMKAGETLAVTVFNPLAWEYSTYLNLTVGSDSVTVTDSKGGVVPSQVNPRLEDSALYDLWIAVKLPALGSDTYFVSIVSNGKAMKGKVQDVTGAATSLTNGVVSLSYDDTGRMSKMSRIDQKWSVAATHDMMEYKSYTNLINQDSGDYIFRPDGVAASVTTKTVKATMINGPLVFEMRQEFDGTHKQVVRLFNSTDDRVAEHFDIDYLVGPMEKDRELIMRFDLDMVTNGVIYTDNNGREMRKRVYDPKYLLPIPANYYPMVSSAYLKDTNGRQLTLVSQRTHGCASLDKGQIETMLHRRTSVDDRRGAGEPLDDTDVIKGTIRAILSAEEDKGVARHPHIMYLNYLPTILVNDGKDTRSEYIKKFKTELRYLATATPVNVHLLSLNVYGKSDETVVLRLHHLFEEAEDAKLSAPVKVGPLEDLFNNLSVTNVDQRSLNAVWKKSDLKRWVWKTSSDDDSIASKVEETDSGTYVTLEPQHIETFFVTLKEK